MLFTSQFQKSPIVLACTFESVFCLDTENKDKKESCLFHIILMVFVHHEQIRATIKLSQSHTPLK